MATRKIFIAQGLTGGAAGNLDAIDGDHADMVDGSLAYTTEGNAHYTHQLDATSGLAESSPAVIAPDTNPGDKRWRILQEPNCRSQLYEASRDLRQKGYGLDIDSEYSSQSLYY